MINLNKARRKAITEGELRVIKLLNTGLMQKQVAYDLGITKKTVEAHAASVFRKLGVSTIMRACYLLRISGQISDLENDLEKSKP